MAAVFVLAMVSLGYIVLFTNQEKVGSSQICSSFTENGWLSVDPANRVCFKYYNNASTWWDAKRSCEQEGLFLARPDRESINVFLYTFEHWWILQNSVIRQFWIGGINQKDSGWKWTNGDKMDYTNFGIFSETLNRIISFFRKSTSCAMYRRNIWSKESCDEVAPYLCQSASFTGRNTTLAAEKFLSRIPRTQFSDTSTKFCHQSSVSTRRPACFVFFEERLTWWDANKTCHEQNMTLVIVRDRVMNELMKRASSYTISGFWIGAVIKDDTGWKWGNGEDMAYNEFSEVIVTWDRLFKQTLCGVMRKGDGFLHGWRKYDCDSFYPFVCELSQNSDATSHEKLEISEQATSPSPNSGATSPVEVQMDAPTTSPAGLRKARKRIKPQQRIFKAKKVVGGQINPKLVNAGLKKATVFDPLSCCRLCSAELGCELVNYCEISRSCVLYGNFESSVRGGVTSERGCSVYVAMEKGNR